MSTDTSDIMKEYVKLRRKIMERNEVTYNIHTILLLSVSKN